MKKIIFIFFLIPTIVSGFFIFTKSANAAEGSHLDSLSPNEGPPYIILTINGSGFRNNKDHNSVLFTPKSGGASFLLWPKSASENQLKVDLSQSMGLARPSAVGDWKVEVYTTAPTATGWILSENSLTFTLTSFAPPSPPHLDSLSPTKGPPETILTINGRNFNPDETIVYLRYDRDIQYSPTTISETQLTIDLAHPPGYVGGYTLDAGLWTIEVFSRVFSAEAGKEVWACSDNTLTFEVTGEKPPSDGGTPPDGTPPGGTPSCPICPEDQRGGLVPCGRSCDNPETEDWNECDPCTFCHLFLMFNIIIKFVMSKLVPILAVLMLIIGGIMYFFAGASPQALSQAKSIITSVAIGLAIIFCAWIIINTVLVQSGIVKAESILKWYEISCGVE